jgi:hypothetical protein
VSVGGLIFHTHETPHHLHLQSHSQVRFYGIKSGEAGTIISDAFEDLNALIDILMDNSYERPLFARADSSTVFHRSFLILNYIP